MATRILNSASANYVYGDNRNGTAISNTASATLTGPLSIEKGSLHTEYVKKKRNDLHN